MSEQEKDARVEAAADTVQLVGVKADGSEHALGTIRMPANMKAREIVRELLGPIDEEAGNDAAIALWACERLLKYVEGAKPALAPAPADAAQASAEGEALTICRNFEIAGPDAEGLVWLVLHGNGTSGKAMFQLGSADRVAVQVAIMLEKDRRAALSTHPAPAPAVPEGMRLVPVEPTKEMLTAADQENDMAFIDGMPHGATAADIWAAMLAAAPEAPAPSTCPHDGQCHPGFCPCKESGNG